MRDRRAPAAVLLTILLAGCQSSSTSATNQLAADQTLKISIHGAPAPGATSLDPGFLAFTVETGIGDNVFDGLYRFNAALQLEPDLATALPTVSADGMTYTFHLRHDARFWNGDSVTAKDITYRWNRAAALQGTWSQIFQQVAGYDAVANTGQVGPHSHLDLTASDPYTLTAHLTASTGYWVQELVEPAAWVVDSKVVDADPNGWWKTPAGLVGTGPFRMTDWNSAGELDFAPVPGWWGGSTGVLKRVELHVVTVGQAWAAYAAGTIDVLGYNAPNFATAEGARVAAMLADPAHRSEVHSWPHGATDWIQFNLVSGPFSGVAAGRDLRRAFSEAIDRSKLAQAVCQQGTVCVPATGGLISKGLQGYLGDGTDPGAKFDPADARSILKRLDPSGTLLSGITFYYPVQAYDPTANLASNLEQQWTANLGIKVSVRALGRETFFTDESFGTFNLWRQGWEADYDDPQDWYDNIFINNEPCGRPICNSAGTIYDNRAFESLIAAADHMQPADALPGYMRAGQMLAADYAYAAVYYLVETAIIKPYVQGFTANALSEGRWTTIQVLQH